MNIDRLLGTNLNELYETADRESKLTGAQFDGKIFSSILISSLPFISSIHEDEQNFSKFVTILARGVATVTEEEIYQHNLVEIIIRECLICSSNIHGRSGNSQQEAMGQLLKFFINKYPADKMKPIVKKYGHSLNSSQAHSLKYFYQRVMHGL